MGGAILMELRVYRVAYTLCPIPEVGDWAIRRE